MLITSARVHTGDNVTIATLNIDEFPFDREFSFQDGPSVDLGRILFNTRPLIEYMGSQWFIKENPSFGFAMTKPLWEDEPDNYESTWNDPHEFVWLVGGWGPDRDRYIANAIRKLRPLLRYAELSTLDMHFYRPDQFKDPVESREQDGSFKWGDFPYGGAVYVQLGDISLHGACSAFTQIQDDMVTRVILTHMGEKILESLDSQTS